VGRGTNPAAALDHLNKIVTRRAVVFFISDFQAEDFSRALAVTGEGGIESDCDPDSGRTRKRGYRLSALSTLEDAENGRPN